MQHGKREVGDQLQATLDYLNQAWTNFLAAFCDEFVLDKYTENRRHKIDGVYQQKMKDSSQQDFSYAFISAENDFASMPKEIYVLLAYDREEIAAHVCPFANILVRGNDEKILGRYTAETSVGDDCLLYYRKYVKDEDSAGATCLAYEALSDTTFFHYNPFFDVITVSDDEMFIARVEMPF